MTMLTAKALVIVSLIAAITALVITGHEFWAVGAAFMLIAACDHS